MSLEQENIKYDSNDNFIVMKAGIEASADTMQQSFNHILEMSEIEDCNNVLIDATKTRKLPSIWNMHLVATCCISKRTLEFSKRRIAFAVSDDLSDKFGYFDNVLVDRMEDVRIFKNVDEAKEWLLSKE
ncbi:hypothetical protein ACFL4H_01715 [Candidatus Neomarinimicrobiota bacterium]